MLPLWVHSIIFIISQASQISSAPVSSSPKEVAGRTANQPEKLPTLYHLIKNRPRSKKKKALRTYHAEFAHRPEVSRIKLDAEKLKNYTQERLKVAQKFHALRGNVVDRPWNRKMTKTMNEYLSDKEISEDVIDAIHKYSLGQRRAGVLEREKQKRHRRTPEQVREASERRTQQRLDRFNRWKMANGEMQSSSSIIDQIRRAKVKQGQSQQHDFSPSKSNTRGEKWIASTSRILESGVLPSFHSPEHITVGSPRNSVSGHSGTIDSVHTFDDTPWWEKEGW